MRKNGGFAFPHVGHGMTLRDYFAAKAMTKFIDYGTLSDDEYFHNAARAAYKLADAMLEEREKE